MTGYYGMRLLAALVVISVCFTGYTFTQVIALDSPEYDLTIDDIPVNFTLDRTMRIDTQTNDRAFIIYNDHLRIRSQYLTFWDFNETYDHEDVNLVVGSYCYATVPAENLTLDSITEINRFQLSSWNGTVSVQCLSDDTDNLILEVNSTDDATLLIRAVNLEYGNQYRVIIDGDTQGWLRVNWQRYFEYNYTGSWSNHTIQFLHIGGVTYVPNVYLNIIQVALILGLVVAVANNMILPLRQKELKPKEVTDTLIRAGIYIAVGTGMITIVFHLFVGV